MTAGEVPSGLWGRHKKTENRSYSIQSTRSMPALPRFRDSWFVQAGIAIAAVSVLPFVVVSLAGLVSGKEFGAGPTGILSVLGVAIGSVSILLGVLGVLVRRRDSTS